MVSKNTQMNFPSHIIQNLFHNMYRVSNSLVSEGGGMVPPLRGGTQGGGIGQEGGGNAA